MSDTAMYDLAAIMRDAWDRVRASAAPKAELRFRFRRALRAAWGEAKHQRAMAARDARLTAETPDIRRTRHAIDALESKSHLAQADYARLGVLRAALRAKQEIAEQHEKAAPNYAEKRALIEAAGGRFCAVTFTKKDGTERTMQVQPATLKHHVKGDAASDASKQAVATRKATHPNLLPVWDAKAKAPRSVNLATVSKIKVDGTTHTYAA